MRTAVVVFPGSNCEYDVVYALNSLGGEADLVWHRETDLADFHGVILPGGFAHGDYLRTGAIARFSPVMNEVRRMAESGAPVLGICNGFQMLCEAELLPGALIADVEVIDSDTVLTRLATKGDRIRIPLNSYEGNWVDPSASGRVILRYLGDPNGSQSGAAAVANERGNVAGVMPHPERGIEDILGSSDGQVLLESFLQSLVSV
jgi:phosphoribosylformylglycinamidine synthase